MSTSALCTVPQVGPLPLPPPSPPLHMFRCDRCQRPAKRGIGEDGETVCYKPGGRGCLEASFAEPQRCLQFLLCQVNVYFCFVYWTTSWAPIPLPPLSPPLHMFRCDRCQRPVKRGIGKDGETVCYKPGGRGCLEAAGTKAEPQRCALLPLRW